MTKRTDNDEMNLISLSNEISRCDKCALHKTRNLTVPGEGPSNARILFVGEAPGRVNDQCGKPFVGTGGKMLDRILNDIGYCREGIYITNAVKCWPPENRRPHSNELKECRIYLMKQISLIKPELIIAFGAVAFEALTQQKVKLKSQHGIINKNGVVPVCGTFHPNSIRYIKGGISTISKDIVTALKMQGIVFSVHSKQGDLFNDK